ncbi:MAG: TolB family protein, partial [Bacteroidales bacterium]
MKFIYIFASKLKNTTDTFAMMNRSMNKRIGTFIFVTALFMHSCSAPAETPQDKVDSFPDIYPDYVQATIPPNIAPLNFQVKGASQIKAQLMVDGETHLEIKHTDQIRIPQKQWKALLNEHPGKTLQVQLSVWNDQYPRGVTYKPFPIHVAPDSIDSHLVYRLIEPGYEGWNRIEILQRPLCSFDEHVVFTNQLLDNGCINCHSFRDYSAKDLMFHVRGSKNGTVIVRDNQPEVVRLEASGPQKNGTYPMWHPSGNFIILSSNTTRQAFHAYGDQPLEVYDLESDLILYDVNRRQVINDNRFITPDAFETFPAWAPSGDKLYFCTAAPKNMPLQKDSLWYSICAVSFDAQNGSFGQRIDTLYNGERHRKSASFPRISPDGKYLLFTESDYATFPIWHKEAELKMIRLSDHALMPTDILNSPESESYHSWSSNGRWLVFSSRRLDGLYTHLYLAHWDTEGNWSKPFALPQS